MTEQVDIAVVGSVGYTVGAAIGATRIALCDRCGAVVTTDRTELHDRWHGSSVLDLVVADLDRTQDELDPIRIGYRRRPHLYVVLNPPWPQTDTADDRIPEEHRIVLAQATWPNDGPTGHLFAGMANTDIQRGGIRFANTDLDEGLDDLDLVTVYAHNAGNLRMVTGMGRHAVLGPHGAVEEVDTTHLVTMTNCLMRLAASTAVGLYPDHLRWTVGVQVDQLHAGPRLGIDTYIRVGAADWAQLADPDATPYFDPLRAAAVR